MSEQVGTEGSSSAADSGPAPETGAVTTMGTGDGLASTTGEGSSDDSASSDVDTGPADDTTGRPPNMFVCSASEGVGDCNPIEQDCPAGQRCVPVGDGTWTTTMCFDVADNPRQAGETCNETAGVTAGLDDCDRGLMCWSSDPQDPAVCRPLCDCTEDGPACDGGDFCNISNGGVLPLCTPACDPILQNCPSGDGCYFDDPGFSCSQDASSGRGDMGDPCEFINSCSAGLGCLPAPPMSGCAAAMCCAAWCELGAMECTAPMACTPVFEANMAPVGYEDVGYCA